VEPKKVRHSRLSPGPTSRLKHGQLPSPLTHKESTASDDFKEGTATPPNAHQTPVSQAARSPKGPAGLSSPPSDTQAFSQFVYPPVNRTYAVEDEEGQKVWGYLVPMDDDCGKVLVLRRREACPVPTTMVGRTNGREQVPRDEYRAQEEKYEQEKQDNGVTAGGYLIGRHRECGK
jgi:serine/threonine-protein kinase Chk2